MDHIGIDVHKKESQTCIVAEDGELPERWVRTTPQGLADVLGERPRARILLEASTESECDDGDALATPDREQRGDLGSERSRQGQGAVEKVFGTAGGHAVTVLAEERPDEGDAPGAGTGDRVAEEQAAAHGALGIGPPMCRAVGPEQAADLTFLLVHVDANMVHGEASFPCARDLCEAAHGRVRARPRWHGAKPRYYLWNLGFWLRGRKQWGANGGRRQGHEAGSRKEVLDIAGRGHGSGAGEGVAG